MRLAVFASGTGSNFQAIKEAVEAKLIDATLVLLVCDKPGAAVLDKAAGIETLVFNPKDFASKKDYEQLILEKLLAKAVDLCVLAGYMRLIGETLLDQYRGRIINIHPSLLPNYKGKDAFKRSVQSGDEVLGVSVHFVDETLDGGAVIKQASFLRGRHPYAKLEAMLHEVEHALYITVLKEMCGGNHEEGLNLCQ